jgi:carboxymethylenebutenolidase
MSSRRQSSVRRSASSAGAARVSSGEEQSSEVISSTKTFEAKGARVRLEMFLSAGEERLPAVIVVHGAGGIDAGNRYVRGFAQVIAEQGFATIVLHYFDSTGTVYANDYTIRAKFHDWLEVLQEGVSAVAGHPRVDPDRLAVLGYSLGAFLAMALSVHEPRIRAVIELAGGIDAESAAAARRLPPTLIVHGKEDRRVPFSNALELQRVLERTGTAFETRLYPDEGHILSAGAALDTLNAGLEFLHRHLAVSQPV